MDEREKEHVVETAGADDIMEEENDVTQLPGKNYDPAYEILNS